jgi:hypothetical protein
MDEKKLQLSTGIMEATRLEHIGKLCHVGKQSKLKQPF